MADQVRQSFHSGKRYKGKIAWNKVYLTDEEIKNEEF
tara:strand:+ start:723 stop:833 length:111 start_codon:yes stop_codon:yes gene_type:complete